MKICITGYSGFLGSNLSNYLSKKFTIKKINLRKLPELDNHSFYKFLDKIARCDVIINCAASLKPKTANDFFINQDFPHFLQTHIKKKKLKTIFIHISTINVLISSKIDPYTISKKVAEKKLKSKNTTILRLSFLYKSTNDIIQSEGNLKVFFDYLNLGFLPIYPMIYPGHSYQAIEIKKILIFIGNLILRNKKSKKIYNILGYEKKKLWDFYYQIATLKKKRVLKINFLQIEKLMPNFIKLYIKKNHNFIQQLLSIDNSKFHEKKTFL